MKHQLKKLLAVAALATAFVSVSQAQWYIAGDFQGWSANSTPMIAGPNAGEFSYTVTGGTPGAYGNCKVTDGTFANTWPSQNLYFLYDSTGSATIHFWPGQATDGWAPYNNRVGFDPSDNILNWGIAGDFDGWDGTQAILPLAPQYGVGVYSNSIPVNNATGSHGFKFQSPAGSWANIYFGQDFGNNNNNGSFDTPVIPTNMPVVLDLPNGRYLIGTPAVPPINNITFTLNLSAQVVTGQFTNTDPNTLLPVNSVAIAGDFIGWGTGAQLTNYTILNPGDSNPGSKSNWYIGTYTYQGYLPHTIACKFRVNNLDGGYEQPTSTGGGDRHIAITNQNQSLFFAYDDANVNDLVQQDTTVMFSLYMPDQTAIQGGLFFTKGSDTLYVNGPWHGYDWGNGQGVPLIESGTPDVYTNTWTFPRGSSLAVTYKFSADGPDNENGSGTNHIRYIRTYNNSYAFPQDVWSYSLGTNVILSPGIGSTNNIVEPSFGYLKAGAVSGGNVPVTWLGRPGVVLQSSSSVPGTWSDVLGTDGTQAANIPNAGSEGFFRLKKN